MGHKCHTSEKVAVAQKILSPNKFSNFFSPSPNFFLKVLKKMFMRKSQIMKKTPFWSISFGLIIFSSPDWDPTMAGIPPYFPVGSHPEQAYWWDSQRDRFIPVKFPAGSHRDKSIPPIPSLSRLFPVGSHRDMVGSHRDPDHIFYGACTIISLSCFQGALLLTEVLKEREAQLELARLKGKHTEGKDKEAFEQQQRDFEESIRQDQLNAAKRNREKQDIALFQKAQ